MKPIIVLLLITLLATSCSFAPLGIPVADTELTAVNTLGTICYGEVHEKAPVNFTSVSYIADALYSSGTSAGQEQGLDIIVYARVSDPLPGVPLAVKCILQATKDDKRISGNIHLTSGQKKQISVGGNELAAIVTNDKYWIGVSTVDTAFLSFPGTIKLTNGSIQAFF